MTRPLPRTQTAEELAESLLIASPQEMIDKLAVYAEAGVDRMILNINFGMGQAAQLDCIQQLAEEVMPHFVSSAGTALEAAE
ncbi:MAG: hypothetical protein AAFZ01_14340 [Pseudomonadota bacterium]